MLLKLEKILSKKWVVLSVIAAVALIVYANSFNVQFTLDDFGSISNNYSIRNPFDLIAIWKFYSNRFIIYWTFSVNFFIHNYGVEGYHVVNLVIHALNGFLVFLILHTLLGLPQVRHLIPAKCRNLICLLAALVFVVHPVQVNAVTYIVQRTAALAATFYFLAILFYFNYRMKHKLRYFLLTLLFIILAMFTKENTITIPFMLILIECMFFLKDDEMSWLKRLLIWFVLLLTVPIIPGTNLFLHGYSQSDPNVQFMASTSMDRFQYFYTQMNVIVHYIKDLLFPSHLNFDYSNDYLISKTIWSNYSYISFAFLALIGILGLMNWRRNKLICFGVLWFFMGLAVESSFISIKDVYFEHRLYFPIVGFILFFVGLIFDRYPWKNSPKLFHSPFKFFIVAFGFMLLMYSGVTLYRNYVFSDLIRLWSDVADKAPKSDRAHCILATNYLDRYNEKIPKYANDLDDAEKEFKISLSLNPQNSTSRSNLSKVYLLKKEYEKCIEEANKVSNSKYANWNKGRAYEGLDEDEKAIDAYFAGLRIDYRCTFILKSLADLYNRTGDYANAKHFYEQFLKFDVYSDNKAVKKTLSEVVKKLESKE